jgi:hypothetical protein
MKGERRRDGRAVFEKKIKGKANFSAGRSVYRWTYWKDA